MRQLLLLKQQKQMVPPALLFYLSSAEFPSPRLESYIHVEEQLFTTRLKNSRLSPPGTSVCSHCNSFSLWKSWSTVPFAMASSGRLGVEQLQTQQICIVFLEDVEYVQALHTESFFLALSNTPKHVTLITLISSFQNKKNHPTPKAQFAY